MSSRVVRFAVIVAFGLVTLLACFSPVLAADTRAGQTVTIPSGDVVNDDLYLAGSEVIVNGTVNGDVVAAGSAIVINGNVNGSVIAAGSTVTISGRVNGSVRAAGSAVNVTGTVGSDLVSMAGLVTLASSASVGRDLVANAGTLDVGGPVTRNVKCNAGTLVLRSSVGGSVSAETGELRLEPSAVISGNLDYTSANEASMATGALIRGQLKRTAPEQKGVQVQPSAPAIGAAVGGILGIILGLIFGFLAVFAVIVYLSALVTGIVILLVARKHVEGVVESLRSHPWLSLGWGALVSVLTPIAVAIACAVIIGIPLAVAALAVFVIALYLGHIIASIAFGRFMLRRFSRPETIGTLIGALALGLLVTYILGLIPFVSIVTDLAAVLFGFGAICYHAKTRPR